jgi:hypothetical protein
MNVNLATTKSQINQGRLQGIFFLENADDYRRTGNELPSMTGVSLRHAKDARQLRRGTASRARLWLARRSDGTDVGRRLIRVELKSGPFMNCSRVHKLPEATKATIGRYLVKAPEIC